MQHIKNVRLATQAITAVVLLIFSCAAGADQMMRALPGTTPATAPAAKPVVVAPAGLPLSPDLTFSFVTVEQTTYNAQAGTRSIVVRNLVAQPLSSHKKGEASRKQCNQSITFPLQLIVKNIGQADYVPFLGVRLGPNPARAHSLGVHIGPWGSEKDIIRLRTGESQAMNFNVTLPPGSYTLDATVVSAAMVEEARTDNNKLAWPLEVKCERNPGMMVPSGGGVILNH